MSSTDRLSRRSFLGGAAALALAGCKQESPATALMRERGIQGPALVYITLDGCVAQGGPHELQALSEISRRMQLEHRIPTYMVDISGIPLPPDSAIRDLEGNAYPGIYVHASGTAEPSQTFANARTMGFAVVDSNPFAHSGNILLIDADRNVIAESSSKLGVNEAMRTFSEPLSRQQSVGRG